MSGPVDIAKLEFKYRRLSAEQKLRLLERLRERFELTQFIHLMN